MNRPIKPKAEDILTFDDFMSASGKWERDIQEYCDYLEERIEQLEKENKELKMELFYTKKQIDYMYQMQRGKTYYLATKEELREWCMKDD